MLPPVAVALGACAVVLFTIRSTGARPGLVLWGVLAGAVSVTLAAVVIAAVAADRAARSVHDRVGAPAPQHRALGGRSARRGRGVAPRRDPAPAQTARRTAGRRRRLRTARRRPVPRPRRRRHRRRPGRPALQPGGQRTEAGGSSSTSPGACSRWCTGRSPSWTSWRTRSRTPTSSRASSTSTTSPPASAAMPRTSP
ncbi:hypothetical protein LV779_27545 [Streptomyces thinghirensis]|nr:hypothetical protein [Streptomyces thinghirensis]